MAYLFKPLMTRYVDATRRRVAKSTPGAIKVTHTSKYYYGHFRGPDGTVHRVPLHCTDRSAAQTKFNELIRQAERCQVGFSDPHEQHAKRPLTDHLDNFQQHLLDQNNTKKYVGEVVNKIRRILNDCKMRHIRDLAYDRVEAYLGNSRRNGMSIQTSNHYVRAIKEFSRWLVRSKRTAQDALAELRILDAKADRRHERRPLTEDEFARLVDAAFAGSEIEGVSGIDRAMMYVLAAWTGYRRAELASLTLRSFDFENTPATVTIKAAYAKNRREDRTPLHPELVEQLRGWIAAKPGLAADTPCFP